MIVKDNRTVKNVRVHITVRREFGEGDMLEKYAVYAADRIAEKIFPKKCKKRLDKSKTE